MVLLLTSYLFSQNLYQNERLMQICIECNSTGKTIISANLIVRKAIEVGII